MANNFSFNEYLVIDTTGSVGIGSTNPQARFFVTGSSTVTNQTAVLFRAGTASQTGGVGLLDVQNSTGTSLFFVSGSGNVGIGNSTPGAFFTVGSSTRASNTYVSISATAGAQSALAFDSGANQRWIIYRPGSSNDLRIYDATGGRDMMVFTNTTSNVGIGATSTVSARLQVSGSATASTPTMLVREGVVSPTGGALAFEVEKSAGSTILSVSGSGFVGIGTAIPTSTFEVVGVSGSLFSVTDSLSGSLFSVNTISGLPILEVFSDNTLIAGAYNSNALVVTGSNVGVGVRAPSVRFQVSGSSISAVPTSLFKAGVGSPTGAILDVQQSDGTSLLYVSGSSSTNYVTAYGVSQTSPSNTAGIFRVLSSATNALIMGALTNSPFATYIQSGGGNQYPLSLNPLGGNVGVGVTNPSYLLDVNGQIRASALVDLQNTSYLVDPASTSVLNLVNATGFYDADGGNARRFVNPGGGSLTGTTSTQTGALKIRFPSSRNNSSTMIILTVKIYEYVTGRTQEYRIGGYNYALGNWYNVFAYNLTDSGPNYSIRFGYDGTSDCIWIGETTSTWTYPQAYITEVLTGYSGFSADWSNGWSMSWITTFDTVEQGPYTPNRFWGNSNDGTGSGLDADLLDGYHASSFGLGTGTQNYVVKWTSTGNALGNSQIYDDATNVGVGTATMHAPLTVYKLGTGNVEVLSLKTTYPADSTYKAITWRDPSNITGQIDTRYNGTTVDMVFGSLYNSGYNSTEVMRITGAGRVGIGTNDPKNKVHILGSSNDTVSRANANLTVEGAGGNGIVVGTLSSSPYSTWLQSGFVSNFGTATYSISLNPLGGNVGIGMTNPDRVLVVRGGNPTIGIYNTTAGGSNLTIDAPTSTVPGQIDVAGAFALRFNTNSAEAMRIDSSQNVGIGTATARTRLHVYGNGQTTANLTDAGNRGSMLRLSHDNTAAGSGGAILFTNVQGDTANSAGFAAIKGLLVDGSNNTAGDLAFSTRNATTDTSLTERVRITFGGNVGIGTDNPTARVHIGSVSSTAALKINHSAGSGYGYAQFGDSATEAQNWHIGSEGNATFRLYNGNWGTGSERLRMDSSGNIAFGTAMAPFSSAGYGWMTANGSAGAIYSTAIAGSEVFRIQSDGAAHNINGISNVPMLFYTNSSERVRIANNTGYVGIGTAGPTTRLHIWNKSDYEGLQLDGVNQAGTFQAWMRLFPSGSAGAYNPLVGQGDSAIIFSRNSTDTGNLVIAPWTNSSNGIKIDNTGNVGIGTSSMTKKLVVNASDALINGLTVGRGGVASNVGASNTALGSSAGAALTVGYSNNTSIGGSALTTMTVGERNTAVGNSALLNYNPSASTGDSTAVGYSALYNTTSGLANSSLGSESLYSNSTGNSNVAVGYRTLYSSLGSENTAVGRQSLYSITTSNKSTAVGFESLYSTTGTENTAVGWRSGKGITAGSYNTVVGTAAMENASGNVGSNVAVGWGTLNKMIVGPFNFGYNVAVGTSAGFSNTTGEVNTFVGGAAGIANTTGSFNTYLGYGSGLNSSIGVHNTFAGYYSAPLNTSGSFNVVVGDSALFTSRNEWYNVAVGYRALYTHNGGLYYSGGIVPGHEGYNFAANTAIGVDALFNSTTGYLNTAVGAYAGADITTGGGNVILGSYRAPAPFNTQSANIFISDGGGTLRMIITGSNGSVGIGLTNPSGKLHVTGSSWFAGTSNTSHINYSTAEDTYIRGGKSGSKVYINDQSGAGDVSISATAGNVGIGTTSPIYGKLQVQGYIANGVTGFTHGYLYNNNPSAGYYAPGFFYTVNCSIYANDRIISGTEFNAMSDLRKKDVLGNIESEEAMRFIQSVKPVIYTWKSDERKEHKYGFIAQDVLKAGFYPLVGIQADEELEEYTDEDGFTSPKGGRFIMSYDNVTPLLTAALKSLKQENDSLKSEIQSLKDQISSILAMLSNK